MVENVSQLRDPYLDIRFRNDNSSLGYLEAMQNGSRALSLQMECSRICSFRSRILLRIWLTSFMDSIIRASSLSRTSLGYLEAMQNGYNQLAHILDEVGKGEGDFGMMGGMDAQQRGAVGAEGSNHCHCFVLLYVLIRPGNRPS